MNSILISITLYALMYLYTNINTIYECKIYCIDDQNK